MKNNKSTKNIYQDWLGGTELEDAENTIKAVGKSYPDWLIVDHYSLGYKWEKKLRPFVDKIFVIDDLANRKHTCNMFLDQNWFKNMNDRYNGLLPRAVKNY